MRSLVDVPSMLAPDGDQRGVVHAPRAAPPARADAGGAPASPLQAAGLRLADSGRRPTT